MSQLKIYDPITSTWRYVSQAVTGDTGIQGYKGDTGVTNPEIIYIKALGETDTILVADGVLTFTVPSRLNGYVISRVDIACYTVSSSGVITVQLHNVTNNTDILSTKATIDINELTSYTAAAPSVIDTSYDDLVTGEQIRVDVDIAGTGSKGLDVIIEAS